MRRFLCLTLLALSLPLFSQASTLSDDASWIEAPYHPFDVEPSTFVHGVNVITGEFHLFAEDAHSKGVVPFALARSYHSHNPSTGNLCRSWHFLHGGKMHVGEESHSASYIKSGSGGVTYLKHQSKTSEGHRWDFDWKKNRGGLTNAGGGILSGRTNPKNVHALIQRSEGRATAYFGSGEQKKYRVFHEHRDHSKFRFRFPLRKHTLASGNSLKYFYDDDHRLASISFQNSARERLGGVSFRYMDEFSLAVDREGGHTVFYEFENHSFWVGEWGSPFKDIKKCKYLRRVHGKGIPSTVYKYKRLMEGGLDEKNNEKQLTKIIREGTSYSLQIDYFCAGRYVLGGRPQIITPKSGCYQRVYQLFEPASPSCQSIATYTFDYDPENRCTAVYNPYGHCTRYTHNAQQQLETVEKLGKGSMRRVETFQWGKEGSAEEGCLLERSIHDERKRLLGRKSFSYDERGNVLEETLYGRLTGSSALESFVTSYEYTKDERNLVAKENHPDHEIERTYFSGKDLLRSQYFCVNGRIAGREFFQYDRNGALTKKIVDDGSSRNEADLTDVTERRWRTFKNKQNAPHAGLPLVEREWALDLATGTEVLLHESRNTYDEWGNRILEEHYDPQGNLLYQLSWKYDDAGRISEEVNPLGHVIRRLYNWRGQVIKEEGPTPGYVVKHTYDAMGRCTSRQEFGQENLFSDDFWNLPEKLSARRQKKTTPRETPARVEIYKYNLSGLCTEKTDRFGQKTFYEYDPLGYLEAIEEPGEEGFLRTAYETDLFGNRTRRIDAQGRVSTASYTLRGLPTLICHEDGRRQEIRYQLDGKVEWKKDASGMTSFFAYDPQGRVVQTRVVSRDGEERSTSCEYNFFHLLREIDEEGVETRYSYDYAGRLVEKRRGPQRVTYCYDSLSRCTHTFNWLDEKSYVAEVCTFDLLNRVIAKWQEDESGAIFSKTEYRYNERGQIVDQWEEVEGELAHTQWTYSDLGDPVRMIDSQGIATFLRYEKEPDPAHEGAFRQKLIRIAADGVQTQTTYDARGLVIQKEVISPYGEPVQKQTLTYDDRKNLQFVKNYVDHETWIGTEYIRNSRGEWIKKIEAAHTAEKRITSREINEWGEVVRELKPSGIELAFAYDGWGQLKEYGSADGTLLYRYQYDFKGRPVRIEDPLQQTVISRRYGTQGQVIEESSMEYEYDPLDRLRKVILPDGSGWSYSYEGRQLSAVIRFDLEGGEIYRHEFLRYDPQGRLLEEKLPQGAGTVEYRYDLCGRKSVVRHARFSESAQYNENGDLVLRAGDESDVEYRYDAAQQLVEEKGDFVHRYGYDWLENRLEKDGDIGEVDSHQRLQKMGGSSYRYDADGNLRECTGDKSISCSYDALGRLVEADTPEGAWRYLYDAFHRRVAKIHPDGKREEFWYVGGAEVASLIDQKVEALRVLLPEEAGGDVRAISFEMGEQVYFPLQDTSRRYSGLLNAEGSLVHRYRWSAFGEEEGEPAEMAVPWRWVGKRYDEETGWFYFGRRMYDPVLGRWTTPDPADPLDGPNLYAYVHNNPFRYFDREGLWSEETIWDDIFQIHQPGETYDPTWGRPAWMNDEQGKYQSTYPESNVVFDFKFESRSTRRNPSYIQQFGFSGKEDLVATNGVWNDPQDFSSNMQYISDLGNGCAVHAVYNASHGKIRDLIECQKGYNYVATTPVKYIHDVWNNYFENASKDDLLGHFCHSQGAIHTRNALLSYPPELRRRIVVVAIAPAVYINKDLCYKVTHYRASFFRDPIPYLDLKGALLNWDTIVTLRSHESASRWDHSFQSPTYKAAIIYEMQEFRLLQSGRS